MGWLKLYVQVIVYIWRCGGLLRLQLLDLEALEHAKVHHFLPLREDEVVLLEVLPQQLYRCLSVLHDNFAVFVVLGRLVQVPPPAALLEDLEQERRVIASANEATVGLEQLTLEVELNCIALVQGVKEFGQHLLLSVAYEGLAAQVAVLRQVDLQLLRELLDDAHVDVGAIVVGGDRGHLLVVAGGQEGRVELVIVLAAEEFISALSCFTAIFASFLIGGAVLLGLLMGHEIGLTLHQESLDRELIDQSNALVDRVVHVDLLLLDKDVDLRLLLFLVVECEDIVPGSGCGVLRGRIREGLNLGATVTGLMPDSGDEFDVLRRAD